MILKGTAAEKFLNKINHAHNDTENNSLWLKLQVISKEAMSVNENESHLYFDYTTYKKEMSLIRHFFRLSS